MQSNEINDSGTAATQSNNTTPPGCGFKSKSAVAIDRITQGLNTLCIQNPSKLSSHCFRWESQVQSPPQYRRPCIVCRTATGTHSVQDRAKMPASLPQYTSTPPESRCCPCLLLWCAFPSPFSACSPEPRPCSGCELRPKKPSVDVLSNISDEDDVLSCWARGGTGLGDGG